MPRSARCCLLALVLSSAPGPPAFAVVPDGGLVVLDAPRPGDLDRAARLLEAAGARITLRLPPDLLAGRIPPDLTGDVGVPHGLGLRVLRAGTPGAAVAVRSRGAAAAHRWLSGRAGRDVPGPAPAALAGDLVLETPAELGSAPKAWGAADCARPRATSAYLAGSVVIGVLLPESAGPDENSEDWGNEDPGHPGEDRRDLVLSEILQGLDALAMAHPEAALSFTVDFRPDISIPLEPIEHSVPDRSGWINAVLEELGYGARAEVRGVRGYLDDLRQTHEADWAVAAFVADDLNDADNGFPPTGHPFAYALLGGPYLVMTYDNDGWGIERMDVVFVHELGHAFGALDEYASAGNTCGATAGYLRVPNANNDSPPGDPDCLTAVPCVMRGNATTEACAFTRGQVGIRDLDGDGILDVRDAPARSTFDAVGPVLLDVDSASLTGSITSRAESAESPHAPATYTINRVASAEYRLDGGPWSPVAPADGAWGGRCEDFVLDLAALDEGWHAVEVRATTDVGIVEPSPAELAIHVNTDCPDDGAEPDDDREAAAPRPAGRHEGLFHCAFDPDWSRFHLQAGAEVTATITWENAAADLTLELRDAEGRVLASGAGPAGLRSLTATAARAGDHFLVIQGEGEEETAYLLDLTASCLDDPSEPNATPETGTPTLAGALTERVLCAGDRDHYRLGVQAGERVAATIAFDGTLGDLDLELLDPAGVPVAISEGTGDAEGVVADPTEEGVYTVRVLGKGPDDAGVYALTLDATGCVDDPAENDDDAASARPLSPGVDELARLCPSDEDWYSFSLGQTSLTRLSLTQDPAGGDLELELRDVTGDVLFAASRRPFVREDVTVERLPAGDYRVRVLASAEALTPYRLRLDAEDPLLLFVRKDPADAILSWNDAGQECYTVSRSPEPSDFTGADEWVVQDPADDAVPDLSFRDEGVIGDGVPLYCYRVRPHDCGRSLLGSTKTVVPYPVVEGGIGTIPWVVYTITAVNDGAEDAFGVRVVDDLPRNVFEWQILEVPPGATEVFEPPPAGAQGNGRVIVEDVAVLAGESATIRFRGQAWPNSGREPSLADNQALLEIPPTPEEPGRIFRTDDPATRAIADDTRLWVTAFSQALQVTAFWHAEVDVDLRVIDPCGNAISSQDLPSADCDGSNGALVPWDCTSGGSPSRVEQVNWFSWPVPLGTYRMEVALAATAAEDPACRGRGEEDVTLVVQTPEGETYWRSVTIGPGDGFVPVYELTR